MAPRRIKLVPASPQPFGSRWNPIDLTDEVPSFLPEPEPEIEPSPRFEIAVLPSPRTPLRGWNIPDQWSTEADAQHAATTELNLIRALRNVRRNLLLDFNNT